MKQDSMQNNQSLSGLLPDEIQQVCSLKASFRALQIFKWTATGVQSFDEMTNISLDERKRLSENFSLTNTKIDTTLTDEDGTVKLGILLKDSMRVETVLLLDKNKRKTACVSCQVGCPIACSFCFTGQMGYARNLTSSEIVEQFFHLEKSVGTLDNIVFMGMGEPMLNLEAITQAITILSHPKGRNLSKRRITISTSGLCKGIYTLADKGPDVRLAVSLTTANPPLRKQLMPNTNSLEEIKESIRYFNEKTQKRVTLELALMHSVNTGISYAEEVIAFTKGLDVHINLIPWNPISSLPFTTPSQREVSSFERELIKAHVNVTTRKKRGRTIGGACGQLGKSIPVAT